VGVPFIADLFGEFLFFPRERFLLSALSQELAVQVFVFFHFLPTLFSFHLVRFPFYKSRADEWVLLSSKSPAAFCGAAPFSSLFLIWIS